MSTIPNRSSEVAQLVSANPSYFIPGPDFDNNRLNFLRTIAIPSLNKLDSGRWGLMTKTDQNNKIPCDIIMWKDTNEVVDCLAGTGAGWSVLGVAPPAWIWTAVNTEPIPIPEPIPPVDNQLILEILNRTNNIQDNLQIQLTLISKIAVICQAILDKPNSEILPIIFPNYEGSLWGVKIVIKPQPK